MTWQLQIAQQRWLDSPRETKEIYSQIEQEFSQCSGIDWEFDYRWMQLTAENYLLAKLKYPDYIEQLNPREQRHGKTTTNTNRHRP
jgi:hypothetical protein